MLEEPDPERWRTRQSHLAADKTGSDLIRPVGAPLPAGERFRLAKRVRLKDLAKAADKAVIG